MTKLETLAAEVVAEAFPNLKSDSPRYGLDWAAIVAIVIQVLQQCEFSIQEMAERGVNLSRWDKLRISLAVRKSDFRRRDRRRVTLAFCNCSERQSKETLVEVLNEANEFSLAG